MSGHVDDDEAIKALTHLPSHSWLKKYVAHGWANTTCPVPYHIGAGLSLISVTCPKEYGFLYAGSDLYANIYCLLLGRSGEDQKTASLRIGNRIMRTVDPTYSSVYPGSREGLLDSLAAEPKQLMIIDELGDILSSAAKGHLEPVKAALTALWDCSPMSRVKAGNNVIKVQDPRLSIAAACSLPYLETYTLAQDWHGGFMGRWFVMFGRRKRTVALPKFDGTRIPQLQTGLTSMLSQTQATMVTSMTPAAEQLWNTWFHNVDQRRLPDTVISIRSRGPTMALKVALLLGWDYGGAREDINWKIDTNVLIPAIAITELHIKSLIHLSYEIAETNDARFRRLILKQIMKYSHEMLAPMPFKELLSNVKMNLRDVNKYLDTLVAEGKIQKSIQSNQIYYDLIDESVL